MKILSITLAFLFSTANLLIAQNAEPTIKTTQISDHLYEFFIYVSNDNSVNLYALIGADGVLMIDAGFRGTTGLVKEALSKITNKEIKYIINTHHNGDHTGGNAVVGEGATIIAHQACRDVLLQNPRFPASGLPGITFQDSMTLHFNGENIALTYFPGHTSSDIIIHFRTSNMVFTGDLVFSEMFPLVQPDGSIYLLEKSISALSGMFRQDTRIMVSHGREMKVNELKTYYDMMIQTKIIVLKAIQEGKSPIEAKNENILKDWRKWDSKLFTSIHADSWIDNLYSVLDESKALSAFHILRNEYEKNGLEALRAKYQEITKIIKRKPFFIETDFNNWGYALVAAQKLPDAIEVFKINTEMFPESWNAFDSLGETYMAVGNKQLAIENYEKSLNLKPDSQSGKDALRQLKGK
jgi:glyoxylase-like metal-dependent hydrolase (beta-lactamase superfamily II)